MCDIKRNKNSFYQHQRGTVGLTGKSTVSFEARLLLPLKCLAYEVPPHTCADYFQMPKSTAKECIKNFNLVMKQVYTIEYLRLPIPADLKAITKLHKTIYGVDGMSASLDACTQFGRVVLLLGKVLYKGKRKSLQLFWKISQITTYGSGT